MDDFNQDMNLPGGGQQQQPGQQATFGMKKGFLNSSSTSSSKKKKKKSSENNKKQNAAVIQDKKDESATVAEKESEKEVKARMKKGKKLMRGEEFECTMTHAGPAMEIPGQGLVLPTSVPSGLSLVRSAIYEFMSHRGENVQYGEKAYTEMYQDIVDNEAEWVEFFQHPANDNHCSDVCHILNVLSEILCDRKELERCGKILEMEEKLVAIAVEHYPNRKFGDWKRIIDGLYNGQYTFYMMVRDYAALVPLFRRECDLEIEKGLPGLSGDSSANGVWRTIVGQWCKLSSLDGLPAALSDDVLKEFVKNLREKGDSTMGGIESDYEHAKRCRELGRRCLGVRTHHDLSDELLAEVLKQINETHSMEKITADKNRDVHLSVCGGCNKQESCCGEYNRCQRCKNVYYCSRECQVNHWKVHQKVCSSLKKRR